jgi:bacteriorhodopsin
MNILNISAFASLFVQVVTGGIEAVGLTYKVRPEDEILKDILLSELIVQFVEFLFYCYLVYKIVFQRISSAITSQRYIDWSITTPIMLINFAIFFIYLDKKNNKESNKKLDYSEIIKQEKVPFLLLVVANALMLLFGYLGEIGILNNPLSTAIGFIPFAFIFKQLYSRYVGKDLVSLITFYAIFLIWALYGVAAVLPFALKNTFYNILDLFSKNAFGLFLFFFLRQLRI